VKAKAQRLYAHVRRLWPGFGVLAPLPFVVWALGSIALGRGRFEHVVILLIVPLMAYTNAASKRLFLGLAPMGALGLVYDTMKGVKNLGVSPHRVHLCDLRALDMRIASVTVNGEPGTVHDWLQLHASTPLDLLFAVPYGTFLFLAIGFAIVLYVRDYERMRLFAWGFLVVNLAGFVTYHLYPAAPPWYFHAHGCTVDMAAHASEGPNLARVDQILGFHYFRDFYGRSSDVFGAVPSLHVSYPMLVILFGWPTLRWAGRTFALVFLVSMCMAAIYLDHHWIIDVVLGVAYTIAAYAVVLAVAKRRSTLRSRSVVPRSNVASDGAE
jgi:membrane-associated phospholipid phosphatase